MRRATRSHLFNLTFGRWRTHFWVASCKMSNSWKGKHLCSCTSKKIYFKKSFSAKDFRKVVFLTLAKKSAKRWDCFVESRSPLPTQSCVRVLTLTSIAFPEQWNLYREMNVDQVFAWLFYCFKKVFNECIKKTCYRIINITPSPNGQISFSSFCHTLTISWYFCPSFNT